MNSVTNPKSIAKKNLILKKVKNLKQNFQDFHKNKYNIFHSKSGKTAKVSPINFHNRIIGYVNKNNINKTNLNIPNMISKVIEKVKSNSRPKSNPKSKKKKSKEQSRNIKQNISKFNRININKQNNFQNKINYIQNKNISKTQNNSNNQTRIINKQTNKRTKKNKILQRNLLINNNNNISNTNNSTYFNLVTSTKQSHNIKVMKIINNIFAKKKKNNINIRKSTKTAINSRSNTHSKDKKNSMNNKNMTHYINKPKNIFNNNNKVIKNLKNNIVNNIIKKKNSNIHGNNIIRNIIVFYNNKNKSKYQSIINKYPIVTQGNNKLNKNNINYNNLKSEGFTKTSNNIKIKHMNANNTKINNKLLNSYMNNIIKIRSEQNSKTKAKSRTNLKNKISNKKLNKNVLNKCKETHSNSNYKLFPLTSTNTKNIINYQKNSKPKNQTKSKSKTKTTNYNKYSFGKKTKIQFNITENRKSKSQSNSKNKSKHKSNSKNKELNNIYNNRYSMNKKRNIIINIRSNYNKKNKFEKKFNNTHKRNGPAKRNNNHINNFIINIFPNKSVYPEPSIVCQKIIKDMNLTSSLMQNNSKGNKFNNMKNDDKNYSSHSVEKYNKNNYTNDDLPILINNKDFYYYNEISKKLSEKIRKYGKEHNYNEYPKTDLSFYQIGRSIGHGAFGKVNIALHVLSGHIVCIKSFNKKKNIFSWKKIKNEIKIMNKLRKSNNIVKLFELFETKNHYCLVMENVVGGNLLNAINKLNKIPEELAKIIFKQLIITLQYIHSNNIVHRDIKPDNILLDLDNTIKLCDFGVSKIIPHGQLINDSCGTPAFIAPEILLESPYDPYATDIWSSGVVLYAMVTGIFPFRGINETQLHENILSGIYPKPKDISKELFDLLSQILNVNPNKRISLEKIMEHPWLKNDKNLSLINKNSFINLNLFTKAEKIIYGKLKLNYKKENRDIQLENFTNKNIDSYYEEENQNVQTMSFVFTPYNSNRERDGDEDLYYDDIIIEDNILQFTPKVQEISRLYEMHNNYEFDQGYIIEKKELWRKRLKVSIKNSYENDNNKNNNKDNNKKEISEINNNVMNINISININKDNCTIDDEAVKFVENFGYKKEFIIKSLESNQLNHATATYYLKLSLKK